MQSFAGLKVVVNEYIKPVPYLQIAPDFKWCSDEFRAKHNAWLLERFGAYDPVYMIGRDTAVVSPAMMAKIVSAKH